MRDRIERVTEQGRPDHKPIEHAWDSNRRATKG